MNPYQTYKLPVNVPIRMGTNSTARGMSARFMFSKIRRSPTDHSDNQPKPGSSDDEQQIAEPPCGLLSERHNAVRQAIRISERRWIAAAVCESRNAHRFAVFSRTRASRP